jgi:hypothetical protein
LRLPEELRNLGHQLRPARELSSLLLSVHLRQLLVSIPCSTSQASSPGYQLRPLCQCPHLGVVVR